MARDKAIPHRIIVCVEHQAAPEQEIPPGHQSAQQCEKFTFKNYSFPFAHIDVIQHLIVHPFREKPLLASKFIHQHGSDTRERGFGVWFMCRISEYEPDARSV
jgi:hypothetical protein